MKKLLWALALGVLVGIFAMVVAEKRAPEGSSVKKMGNRVRSTAGRRPHMPRADLKQPLDEAIAGAAREAVGATGETAQAAESA